MSEPEKASENSGSGEAEKRRRNLSAAAAMMRYAPDVFDQQMQEMVKDPEMVKALGEMTPAKLTPEERELADKMLAKLKGPDYPPGGVRSDAREAWTCGFCGFRGFWYDSPHDCKAAAAAGHQATKPAPK